MSAVPSARLALLSLVTLAFFWVSGTTSFAQTAPAELPPQKARQFLDLLSDPDVKAWLEGKIPATAEEPPAAPLADAISDWEVAVRARLASLADAVPRIPQELSNAAGVVSRDVNSGRPGLVIGILAILIVVGFGQLGAVQNMSRDWVIDKFQLGVTLDTDLEKARKLIKTIGQDLAADPDLGRHILEPLKMQGVEQFGDFAIQIRCKITTRPGEQFVIRRKAYARIKQAFDENGIRFAFPRCR